jgi:hypothetical protein
MKITHNREAPPNELPFVFNPAGPKTQETV